MLITHQMQYLSEARHIIVMRKGKIKSEGSLDVLKCDPEFAHLTKQYQSSEMASEEDVSIVEEILLVSCFRLS